MISTTPHTLDEKKNTNRMGFYAIMLGILYWPIESAIHAYIFQEGTLLAMLFQPEINEAWMRILIASAFTTFGLWVNKAEQKQNELIQKLRYQEARARRIIETACDAYISIDQQSNITDWNPRAEVLFGWRKSEVLGKSLTTTIIPEKFRKAHLQGVSRYLDSSHGPWLYRPIRVQSLTKDGEEITIEITITPLKGEDSLEFYTFIRKVENT